MMSKINCGTLAKGVVLAHLYNNSKPLGMGLYQYKAKAMTKADANKLLEGNNYFDYLHGRPMKINFSNYPELDPWGYDRDNGGTGTMEHLVGELKNGKGISFDVPREEPSQEELDGTLEKCKINVTAFNLPTGKTVDDIPELKQFDKVWFNNDFCKVLEQQGIPYPFEWHMFMSKENGKASFVGSMGGRFQISTSQPCIKNHQSGF
jgi:hypothetical protein